MRPSIKVCIATFGDSGHWRRLAMDRAWASVDRQTVAPFEVACGHGETLAEARNACARNSGADWLCFLDADDELDAHYIEAMADAVDQVEGPVLVQPATLGVHPDGSEDPYPVLIPPKPLLDGNFLVIGTLIRRDQFLRVGGFRELECFEDWDVWLRAWLDGAEIVRCPQAVYRVYVNTDGRNSADRAVQVATYNQIRSRYLNARAS